MADTATEAGQGIETPSGKGAGDENFPVGSWLIAAHHRPCVMAFYRFARGADDIADNPALAPDDKIRRLDLFEAGLDGDPLGAEPGRALAPHLAEFGVTDGHARDLLRAFRQDAVKSRYADWDDLIGYCAVSANPVGRFLLDLHGEDRAMWGASDALCTVLQILNHVQDLKEDLARMDRCYLPGDWMADAGIGVEALAAPEASPALRGVIDRVLDASGPRLADAVRLGPGLRSRRLGAESAVIARLAVRLAGRLGRQDPIAGRVSLSRRDFAVAAGSGVLRLLRP